MQAKQRPVASSKTAQADACLRDAMVALDNRDRFGAELAVLEYIQSHRDGLRGPEQARLDRIAWNVVASIYRLAHDGKLR